MSAVAASERPAEGYGALRARAATRRRHADAGALTEMARELLRETLGRLDVASPPPPARGAAGASAVRVEGARLARRVEASRRAASQARRGQPLGETAGLRSRRAVEARRA